MNEIFGQTSPKMTPPYIYVIYFVSRLDWYEHHPELTSHLFCQLTWPRRRTWWQSGPRSQPVWSRQVWVAQVLAQAWPESSWEEAADLCWGIRQRWTWESQVCGSDQAGSLQHSQEIFTSPVWWEHWAGSPARGFVFVTRSRKHLLEEWKVWKYWQLSVWQSGLVWWPALTWWPSGSCWDPALSGRARPASRPRPSSSSPPSSGVAASSLEEVGDPLGLSWVPCPP